MAFQNTTLNWLSTTDRYSRLDFLRETFDCCQLDEIKSINNLLSNAKKRKSPYLRLAQQERRKLRRVSTPVVPASTPVAPASTPVVPASTPVAPASTAPVLWWQEYNREEVLALDVEMVTLFEKQNGKHLKKPATVALVDYNGNLVYHSKVKHRRGTFLTDNFHVEITGFTEKSLEDGKPFEEVKNKLEGFMINNLIITHDGKMDFSTFGLCRSDWDNFDLQDKFKQQTGVDKHFQAVLQPISLRRLSLHFFGEDIQKGVHDCIIDAKYTMKLFREYQKLAKLRNIDNRYAVFEENEFDNVKKIN